MRYFIASLVAICALWSLTACDDNSPDDGIKPLEERTVLLLKENGEIYSFEGELVKGVCHNSVMAENPPLS